METAHARIKVMRLVLIAGTIIMLFKFLAWYLTDSNAVLTDALESVVNVLAGGVALYALHYASKPKDHDHPYGHGKIEFFSTGFEGGMIAVAGLVMTVKGVLAFFEHNELEKLDWGVWITGLSGIGNYMLGTLLIRKSKQLHSVTLAADGKHLLTDTYSSIGLVLGLIAMYYTEMYWIDAVITLLFGLMITVTGFKLIQESVFNLLDTADYEKLTHIIDFLNTKRTDNWIDLHNLRVVKYGSVVHVDCHMTYPWYYTLEQVHAEVERVADLVKAELPHEVEFFIHTDPCRPKSCAICALEDCPERKMRFQKKLEWSLENVLPNHSHSAE